MKVSVYHRDTGKLEVARLYDGFEPYRLERFGSYFGIAAELITHCRNESTHPPITIEQQSWRVVLTFDDSYYPVHFELDPFFETFQPTFAGYTRGYTWNGFATPYFERSEAERVLNFIATPIPSIDGSLNTWTYNAKLDRYEFTDANNTDPEDGPETWDGFDITVNGETKHVYGIGSWSWTWTEDTTEYTVEPFDYQTAWTELSVLYSE